MSRMLRVMVGVVLAMVVTVSGVWAQSEEKSEHKDRKAFNPERMLGASIEAMKEKLGLSDEQVAKLQALVQDVQKKFEELRAKAEEGDFEGMREEMQTMRTSLMEQVKSILTEEQQAKLKEFVESKRKELGGRFQGAIMNLKLLEEKLDLSEEQILEIKEILTGVREEIKQIREQSQGDPEKMKAAMKDFQDKIVAEVKTVLTDEQKQALDQFMKEWQEKRDQHRKGEEKN